MLPLYINRLAGLDWLIALEFGRVDDAQPREHWRGLTDKLGFLHDGLDGPPVGFKLCGEDAVAAPSDPAQTATFATAGAAAEAAALLLSRVQPDPWAEPLATVRAADGRTVGWVDGDGHYREGDRRQ